MATRTTTEFVCDVCGIPVGTSEDPGKLPHGIENVAIKIVEFQEWATNGYAAAQMCRDCQQFVIDFRDELRKRNLE